MPTRPEGEVRRVYDRDDAGAADDGTVVGVDAGAPPSEPTIGPKDPHGVSGLSPDHGPFKGGTRVVIQGVGFAYKPRVWFGDVEVPQSDVASISTKKVQVNAPAHPPGLVAVAVQNGDDASTRRVLEAAYTYDPFVVEPDEGPTSGGTLLEVIGAGTAWAEGTTVKIGDKACLEAKVASPTKLTCIAPPGAAGVRSVTVQPPGGTGTTVLEAFTYADSDNGFKGGLSGAALPPPPAAGEPKKGGVLRVLAFDSYTGAPLVGAKVFVDDGVEAATIGPEGIALIDGVTAGVTVTVAKKCAQPTSFVAVPVDTVTMYLDPVLSPACAPPEGDPPPVGGKPSAGAKVDGQVVFPASLEFKKGAWSLVPKPKTETERRAAYVFATAQDPKTPFKLPPASQAITEDSPGSLGYGFSFDAQVGNLSLYALAGLEDRTVNPPRFTAYAFGLVRGVNTKPGETTDDVALQIDTTLDQAVTVALDPPQPGVKGPDRVQASVAVSIGNTGFAVFPEAQRTQLLPLAEGGKVAFVGLPALTGALEGFSYVSTAQAGTGVALALPVSVVGRYITTSASTLVPIDGFVAVPSLVSPAAGGWDGQQYDVAFLAAGAPHDLLVFEVASGGGLVNWTITAPAGVTAFRLPDLRKLPGAGLVPGSITVQVTAARIEAFSYGELRYRHLQPRGWSAHAQDAFFAQLAP